MKRSAKKITLSRETLRHLRAADLTKVEGASATLCVPTYIVSCQYACPNQPFSHTNCD